MVRTVVNPFKGVPCTFQPQKTTAVVLTCIPFKEGYYATRFNVLKLCLASLLKHSDAPFDLLVFDNGSIPEVVQFLVKLREEGKIQYLLLSEKNIGYLPALTASFAAAPGAVIAYSDDDVFFYPHWLSQHLEILETYPKVGLVSGRVVGGNHFISSIPAVCKEYGIRLEPFEAPREWGESWSLNLGKEAEWWRTIAQKEGLKQYLLEYKGVKAFSGAQSISFVFRKELLKDLPPIQEKKYVGDDGLLKNEIDRLGYMQLSTYRKTVDHIGNAVDVFWKREASTYGIEVETDAGSFRTSFRGGKTWRKRLLWRIAATCMKHL